MCVCVGGHACVRMSEQMFKYLCYEATVEVFNQLEHPENCRFVVDTRPYLWLMCEYSL